MERDPRFEAVVCGSPEDGEEVAAVAAAAGATGVPPLGTFHQFAAVINACDLLLTPDTCTVHLAAAWRTRGCNPAQIRNLGSRCRWIHCAPAVWLERRRFDSERDRLAFGS